MKNSQSTSLHSRLLVLGFGICFSSFAWAQIPVTITNASAPLSNTHTTTHPTTNSPTNPTTTTSPSNYGNLGNAAGASKSGSDLAIVGEVITGVVGVYTGMRCASSEGEDVMACIMAAQCLLQLAQTAAAQGGADNVNGAYTPGAGNLGTFTSGDPGGGTGSDVGTGTTGTGKNQNGASTNPSGFASDIKKIKGSLASAGIAINPTTGDITLPNGKTVPGNSTPSSLKSSGFDSGQIDQTIADEKKVEAGLLAKAGAGNFSGYQSMGGGGGHAGAANPNASMDPTNGFGNGNGQFGKRNPSGTKASVAGLSKKLGNENIGVKGDNIFEMVNRRYRSQDQQNAFLK